MHSTCSLLFYILPVINIHTTYQCFLRMRLRNHCRWKLLCYWKLDEQNLLYASSLTTSSTAPEWKYFRVETIDFLKFSCSSNIMLVVDWHPSISTEIFFLYISFSYMYVHIDEGKSCGHGLGFQSLNKIQDCATRRSAQISTKKFNLRKVLLLYYEIKSVQ